MFIRPGKTSIGVIIYIYVYMYSKGNTSICRIDRSGGIAQLAKTSIDPKLVEPTPDELKKKKIL